MIKTDRTVLLLLLNQIEQAHFDEILVLMEHNSKVTILNMSIIISLLYFVLILVLMEIAASFFNIIFSIFFVLILILMEHDSTYAVKKIIAIIVLILILMEHDSR